MPIQYKVITAEDNVVNTPNGPMSVQQMLDVFGQNDGELVSSASPSPNVLLLFLKHLSGGPPAGF